MFKYKEIIEDLKKRRGSGGVMTEKTVSEEYGVSRITARRALEELEKKGFVSRRQKKGSVFAGASRRFKVAVVLPSEEANNYKILDAIQRDSPKYNIRIEPYFTMSSEETERECLEKIAETGYDGLICSLFSFSDNIDIFSSMIMAGVKLCFLDNVQIGITAPVVASDNFSGIKAMTRYFIGAGHKRFHYFALHPQMAQNETERFDGFCAALFESGIAVEKNMIFKTDYFIRMLDADRAVNEYFEFYRQSNPVPTAVVCVNDVLADKISRGAAARGLKLSVSGYDNLNLGNAAFSTVEQNFFQIGRKALKIVHRLLSGEKVASKKFFVKVRLIIRGGNCAKEQ